MVTKTAEQQFNEIQDRLSAKFSAIPSTKVVTIITDARNRFSDSKIQDFVPLLVERRATRELTSMSVGAAS